MDIPAEAQRMMQDDKMTSKYISAREFADEWLKDPAHKAAYDALEDEFALAGALIETRSKADFPP
jgi:hypothetical protein